FTGSNKVTPPSIPNNGKVVSTRRNHETRRTSDFWRSELDRMNITCDLCLSFAVLVADVAKKGLIINREMRNRDIARWVIIFLKVENLNAPIISTVRIASYM
uniref:hypothetical protein n=1 Tax=Bartonella sp. CL42QHWL TaxID=3243528 RepID=UPI0035CFBF63